MYNILRLILYSFLPLFIANCSKDDHGQTVDVLKVEMVTLDEEGNEKSKFEEGTILIFALKVINNSNDDIEWKNYCQLLQLEEFYLIYKNIENDNGNKIIQPIGKPYIYPINCQDINLPFYKISAGVDEYIMKSSWNDNPNNIPLSTGNYFTSFTYTLNTSLGEQEIVLKVEFEVY